MKYYIKFNKNIYSISKSLGSAIINYDPNFRSYTKKKTKIIDLNESSIPLFRVTKTTKHKHIYVFFSGKTYRISKKFCNFLSIQPATYNTQMGTKQAHEVFNKFYTKPEVSKFCVETFTSNIQVQKEDLIIEPSAGGGVFIKPLKNITCYKIFIDIAPENEQVKQYDFLAWKPTNTIGKIHVIGNPPFGKQSSLCLKFIKHAAKFADSISFILPLSFKKQHLLSKIPKNFHMLHETIIEKNAFTYNGVNFKLPTVFQI